MSFLSSSLNRRVEEDNDLYDLDSELGAAPDSVEHSEIGDHLPYSVAPPVAMVGPMRPVGDADLDSSLRMLHGAGSTNFFRRSIFMAAEAAPECAICHSVVREAHSVGGSCPHVACKACLEVWLQLRRSCPVCRTAASPHAPVPNLAVDLMVRNLKVTCPEQQMGCEWTGSQCDVEAHWRKCRYNRSVGCLDSVACPNSCGVARMPQAEMTVHVNADCPRQRIQCSYCSRLLPREEMEEHLQSDMARHMLELFKTTQQQALELKQQQRVNETLKESLEEMRLQVTTLQIQVQRLQQGAQAQSMDSRGMGARSASSSRGSESSPGAIRVLADGKDSHSIAERISAGSRHLPGKTLKTVFLQLQHRPRPRGLQDQQPSAAAVVPTSPPTSAVLGSAAARHAAAAVDFEQGGAARDSAPSLYILTHGPQKKSQ